MKRLAAADGLLGVIYLTALAVAAFAFIVSYSHIYDLGAAHAQFGTAGRLLPLSVDLLIVAASLVLFRQSRGPRPDTWLARWLPRIVLWSGIGATVAANVAYGLSHGWLAAVISGWPGAAFVGIVEMVMVAVRPGEREDGPLHTVAADAQSAALAALRATTAAGNPLSGRQLETRFGLSRADVARLRELAAPDRGRGGGGLDAAPVTQTILEPSMNGHADGA